MPAAAALPGVKMPAWLLRFDRQGRCTSQAARAGLLQRLRRAPPADLVVFSHGWNNDFHDATRLYTTFLRHFEALADAYPMTQAGGAFAPVFVGLLWPSLWMDLDGGAQTAAAAAVTGPAAGALHQALAARLAAAGQGRAQHRVQALLARRWLADDQARELAQLLAPAFGTLHDDEAGAGARSTPAETLLAQLHAMQQAHASGGGDAGRPAQVLGDAGLASPAATPAASGPAATAAASLLGALDPRHALRLFSVYQMKDRAGTVGSRGVAALLRELLAAAPAARVHALGHSYGCKVMLAALCAPAPLPRPVDSLLLLQPAVSHLCFARRLPRTQQPGGYHAALSPERVRAPVFATYSRQDIALHKTFHLALRRDTDLGESDPGPAASAADIGADTTAGRPPSDFAALGGYGPRGAGQRLIDPMPDAGVAYPALDPVHRIVGLDGSRGRIGGHGDVRGPVAAWALHQLIDR